MHGLPGGVLDIRKMGNLRAKMETTYRLFLIGALALAGFPLTSGFFSKDGILLSTFEHNLLLYAIGLFTALLTAFYSFALCRLLWRLLGQGARSPPVGSRPRKPLGDDEPAVGAGRAGAGGRRAQPAHPVDDGTLAGAGHRQAAYPSLGLEIALLFVAKRRSRWQGSGWPMVATCRMQAGPQASPTSSSRWRAPRSTSGTSTTSTAPGSCVLCAGWRCGLPVWWTNAPSTARSTAGAPT
ncbi:MAG: proton-conducting transporter membrane subunit [Caldilineaceae bacterium]